MHLHHYLCYSLLHNLDLLHLDCTNYNFLQMHNLMEILKYSLLLQFLYLVLKEGDYNLEKLLLLLLLHHQNHLKFDYIHFLLHHYCLEQDL